ncbi:hypothetical protein K438DRAFT_1983306 [Mycena galopus ATCC 62051]|nr:hypothetical protein K438DRAFT_1983306 [Mycena galopus ATCC 62051]
MFPTAALQAVIASLHFMGVSILTLFISRRLPGDGLSSREAWVRLTWARICILLVFLASYLFLFSSGMLIFGVGLQVNATACATGIYICILLYTSSKILIYAYLSEKVYIVWDTGRSRLQSLVYLVCLVTVCLYAAVIVVMLIGRINEFREGDGACVIGLKLTASLPLLSYDLYINVLLTALFLWPLLRSKLSNNRLRRLAARTFVASAMALTTSTVNIVLLAVMGGRELGWLCLGSCGMDVVFNAAVLFWLTAPTGQVSPINESFSLSIQLTTQTDASMIPPQNSNPSLPRKSICLPGKAFPEQLNETRCGIASLRQT